MYIVILSFDIILDKIEKKYEKKISKVLNTFQNIIENGTFAQRVQNIFKYIVFQRRYYGVKG